MPAEHSPDDDLIEVPRTYLLDLQRLAATDPLTDLPNRRRIEDAVERGAREDQRGNRGALLLVDLDDFKDINDQFGHRIGDRILVAVAESLRASIRMGDLVARIGGDEFSILLQPSDPWRGAAVAKRLLEEMRGRTVEAEGLPVAASVGICAIDAAPVAAGQLWRRVDRAMYAAKARGGARYAVWTPDLLAPSLERKGADTHERVEGVEPASGTRPSERPGLPTSS